MLGALCGRRPFEQQYVALVAGVLAGLVFNFTLSRLMVFKAPHAAYLSALDSRRRPPSLGAWACGALGLALALLALLTAPAAASSTYVIRQAAWTRRR